MKTIGFFAAVAVVMAVLAAHAWQEYRACKARGGALARLGLCVRPL